MQVASSSGPKHRRAMFNEINITPLTDIFLVLLIIMMVVAPVLQQARRDIQPPTIAGGAGLERGKITIEITKEGECYVDGTGIAEDNLEVYLKGKLDSTKQTALVVQADRFTKNKVTMKVYDAAEKAGFNEITIAGQALPEGRAVELRTAPKPADGAPPS